MSGGQAKAVCPAAPSRSVRVAKLTAPMGLSIKKNTRKKRPPNMGVAAKGMNLHNCLRFTDTGCSSARKAAALVFAAVLAPLLAVLPPVFVVLAALRFMRKATSTAGVAM